MKVFVRTSDLTGAKPVVIAFYPDDSDIKDDAHGEGMAVLNVPMGAIVMANPSLGIATHLVDDWRERSGPMSVKAEAKRRIETTFTISDQLNALHELVDIVVNHGADASKWPPSARQHKAELDERWKYIAEVREHVRKHVPAMPRDPSSDKVWPRRIAKK